MATTTNYGWTTPDDTALVKDGASAIRTLGSSVDSTLKTQIDNTVASSIQKSLVTTKGDIIAATGTSTPARLAVSATNGDVLMVDSTAATGIKWATPATGGITQLATGSLSSTSVVISSINQTYKSLYLVLQSFYDTTSTNYILSLRFNGDTGSNYAYQTTNGAAVQASSAAQTSAQCVGQGAFSTTSTQSTAVISIPFYTLTSMGKIFHSIGETVYPSLVTPPFNGTGYWKSTAAISSITLVASGGTMAGTYTLYGVN